MDDDLDLTDIGPTSTLGGDTSGPRSTRDLEAVYDIPVTVSAVLGRATMQVSQLLKLGRGAVVELDRKLGEAIDIYVNNRLVARGEVVMVDDSRLGGGVERLERLRRSDFSSKVWRGGGQGGRGTATAGGVGMRILSHGSVLGAVG